MEVTILQKLGQKMNRVTSLLRLLPNIFRIVDVLVTSSFTLTKMSWTMLKIFPVPSLGTDVWGANTFPVRKYNSRTFHLKVRRSRLFRFFRRFPQINVGGDSARIPFVEHASRESRVALPPKGRLRQLATPLGMFLES